MLSPHGGQGDLSSSKPVTPLDNMNPAPRIAQKLANIAYGLLSDVGLLRSGQRSSLLTII